MNNEVPELYVKIRAAVSELHTFDPSPSGYSLLDAAAVEAGLEAGQRRFAECYAALPDGEK